MDLVIVALSGAPPQQLCIKEKQKCEGAPQKKPAWFTWTFPLDSRPSPLQPSFRATMLGGLQCLHAPTLTQLNSNNEQHKEKHPASTFR